MEYPVVVICNKADRFDPVQELLKIHLSNLIKPNKLKGTFHGALLQFSSNTP
jgi:hypothetical protein